jgi:hypothetical protein
MAALKAKGDLAELKVACDLVERGYRVAIPFGEDCDFDLVFWETPERLERVQVKYTRSDGERLYIKCCSHSLTNGRIRHTKRYTSQLIDWLAAYDASTTQIYYVPAHELGDGMSYLTLRLTPARNNQQRGVRFAADYTNPRIVQPTLAS